MTAIWLAAPKVADRVDAPRDVMHQEDPRQAAPDEAEQGAAPAHREQSAQGGGDEQADEHPEGEGIADPLELPGFQEVGDIAVDLGLILVEQPADVGIP